MLLSSFLLVTAVLCRLSSAQSTTSSSSNTTPTATPGGSANSTGTSGNNTQDVLTTTITSLIPGSSSSAASTSLLTLTLTLNSSTPNIVNNTNGNETLVNGTTTDHSTMTNETVPWKAGDGWIPFHIALDPAYGVLGAFLIITGIPVAVLGGKNRWSSLAIVSGYAFMLFTLVMILRFGVQPNLQPPSPNPPSRTLRGLYLLAGLISSFIGAGLGIFLFKFARYFVSAAGGFAFGWFLLETKTGGLIPSVLGRWGLLGGLTVGAFLISIVPKCNDPMLLISTAWIGATAFVLGVDCYTRAGLKEFYVYNLGFHDVFPKLNGAKYPLTQTMMIELGILAAIVIIGSAIQARVLNRLQKRLREAREEEEMRIEAEEVAKAAERFKNVGSELEDWEEKHGNGSGGRSRSPHSNVASTAHLPILGTDPADQHGGHDRQVSQTSQPQRNSAFSLPPIDVEGTRDLYASVPLSSPLHMQTPGGRGSEANTPTTGWFSIEELKDEARSGTPPVAASPALTDPDLEDKLRLLEEVKKARESIRGSIDGLRKSSGAPSLSLGGKLDGVSRPVTPAMSLGGGGGQGGSGSEPLSRYSIGSRLSIDPDSAMARRAYVGSTAALEAQDQERKKRHSSSSSRLLGSTHEITPAGTPISPTSSEWEKYVAERKILAPPASVSTPQGVSHRTSQYSMSGRGDPTYGREKSQSMINLTSQDGHHRVGSHGGFGFEDRRSRTTSMLERVTPAPTSTIAFGSLPSKSSKMGQRPPTMYDPSAAILGARTITTPATAVPPPRSQSPANQLLSASQKRPSVTRAMTYEELAERHRKRLSALQDPITSRMKEEQDLRIAKERWERQKLADKADMARRERRVSQGKMEVEGRERAKQEEKVEVLKSTDEWRKSVHGGLDGFGQSTRASGQGFGQGRIGRDKRGSRRLSGAGMMYAN